MERDRGGSLRRIVTGVNEAGRSIVAIDGPAHPKMEFPGGTGLHEIWTDAGGALDRRAGEAGSEPLRLTPPRGGAKLRWTVLAPEPAGATREDSERFYANAFASIGAEGDRPDTSRHPGMHLTHTLDFIIVVEGKVRLILDEDERLLGPGDVVVQRGTNHAWSCASDTPAVIVAVLLDKIFADERAA